MAPELAQIKTLLKQILTLDVDKCNLELCIASGEVDDKEYEFRVVNQSQKLTKTFLDILKGILEEYRTELDDNNIELKEFLADTAKEEHVIEHLNILPYDSIKNQITSVERPLDLQYFRHDDRDFIQKMRFYVMHVEVPGESPINFFHRYSPSQMLSHSSLFAMWLQNDEYDALDTPTFLFERRIDCFSYEEHMFILQKNNFFQIFPLNELEKVARETLERLEKKDYIHNFKYFKDDCLRDKKKILKLKNISSNPYLDTLTIDDLHKNVQRYTLPITVDIVGGKKKLVYDRADRWAILHLLDDAYAYSHMTGNSYHVSGKRPIRARK